RNANSTRRLGPRRARAGSGPAATCWNALPVVGGSDKVSGRTDRAGPSRLAAYQTYRAGVSFGRTARRRPDTGRPPGLCTLARSAGKTGGFWQRQGTRRTEADVEDTVRRHVPVTVGTADARGMSGERAATQHTAFAHINTQHVFIIVVAVGPIHRIAFVAF